MPRASRRPTSAIEEAIRSKANTTVLLVGISNYNHLKPLKGPSSDIGFLEELFTTKSVALFDRNRVRAHLDLTCDEFRRLILDYATGCSAKGDVLILYFSGHGCVTRGNEFGFCLRDTVRDNDGRIALPLSIVSFSDVIRTLEPYEIFPVIIIDACYSGMALSEGPSNLQYKVATPHAVIASSSYTSTSIDLPEGGAFTNTLMDVLLTGLSTDDGSLWPYFTVRHLMSPLRVELENRGLPLHRIAVSDGIPRIPLVKNTCFRQRPIGFTPQFKGIILLLWNAGNLEPMDPNDFRERLGTGATNNHSKLSYRPWDLLVDANNGNLRELNARGRRFARGQLKIPRKIIKNPESRAWEAYPNSPLVNIHEIGEPEWR
jgi:hypothetical protein